MKKSIKQYRMMVKEYKKKVKAMQIDNNIMKALIKDITYECINNDGDIIIPEDLYRRVAHIAAGE